MRSVCSLVKDWWILVLFRGLVSCYALRFLWTRMWLIITARVHLLGPISSLVTETWEGIMWRGHFHQYHCSGISVLCECQWCLKQSCSSGPYFLLGSNLAVHLCLQITFDNKAHSGKIKIYFDSEAKIEECKDLNISGSSKYVTSLLMMDHGQFLTPYFGIGGI